MSIHPLRTGASGLAFAFCFVGCLEDSTSPLEHTERQSTGSMGAGIESGIIPDPEQALTDPEFLELSEKSANFNCGGSENGAAGSVREGARVAYRPELMNYHLSKSTQLAKRFGVSRVASCSEAERFSALWNELLYPEADRDLSATTPKIEAGPPEIPLEKTAVRGGTTVTGKRGVVFMSIYGTGGCTGSLIGPRTILTAAHCVLPSIASGKSGTVQVTVYYFDPATGKRQIGGNGDSFQATVYPSYFGGGDYGDDFAILKRGSNWSGLTSNDFLRVADQTGFNGRGGSLRMYGGGKNDKYGNWDGSLRYFISGFGIRDIRAEYITVRATSSAGTCEMDSGGPWLGYYSDDIVGVHSSSVRDGACASSNGSMYLGRADVKRSWITGFIN